MKKGSNFQRRCQRTGVLVCSILIGTSVLSIGLINILQFFMNSSWCFLSDHSFWAKHKHIVSHWNGSGSDADTQILLWTKSYCKCLPTPNVHLGLCKLWYKFLTFCYADQLSIWEGPLEPPFSWWTCPSSIPNWRGTLHCMQTLRSSKSFNLLSNYLNWCFFEQ